MQLDLAILLWCFLGPFPRLSKVLMLQYNTEKKFRKNIKSIFLFGHIASILMTKILENRGLQMSTRLKSRNYTRSRG